MSILFAKAIFSWSSVRVKMLIFLLLSILTIGSGTIMFFSLVF